MQLLIFFIIWLEKELFLKRFHSLTWLEKEIVFTGFILNWFEKDIVLEISNKFWLEKEYAVREFKNTLIRGR